MRASVAVALVIASAWLFVACLVSVDESLLDRSADGGDASVARDASGALDATDARADRELDAGVRDAARACIGKGAGLYCGDSLPAYVGSGDDLVRCNGDGGAGQIYGCPDGCSKMPAGRQDMCNPCVDAGDGAYCGHQLNVSYKHYDVLVTCAGRTSTASRVCDAGCSPSGAFGVCN